MECGQTVEVQNVDGATVVRFIAQCGGRFLVISNAWPGMFRNGLQMADWRGVIRELIALSVPRSLEYEKGMRAQSLVGGFYRDVKLTYPLPVKGLADLFGEDIEAVRELLADLAVHVE